jgi:DNA-binding transcriptional ArsR family regulator
MIGRAMDIETMKAKAREASALLKTLSNPNRLLIVCSLVEGERSVAELEDSLGIRQPNLSQQLAGLREAGLVASRREAKSVIYRLTADSAVSLVDVLHRLFCAPSDPLHMSNQPVATAPAGEPSSNLRRHREAAGFAVVSD